MASTVLPSKDKGYFLTPESPLTSGRLSTNGRNGGGSNGVRAQHEGWPVGRWEAIWRETPFTPIKPVTNLGPS